MVTEGPNLGNGDGRGVRGDDGSHVSVLLSGYHLVG